MCAQPVKINLLTEVVTCGDDEIDLTRTEWDVISALAQAAGYVRLTGNKKWHVQFLRKKGIPVLNKRGRGYRLGDIDIVSNGTTKHRWLRVNPGCTGHVLCNGNIQYCAEVPV